jgi:hypothetical protein
MPRPPLKACHLVDSCLGRKVDEHSAARADELATQDDHNGAAVWRRITDAVGQPADHTPPGPLN